MVGRAKAERTKVRGAVEGGRLRMRAGHGRGECRTTGEAGNKVGRCTSKNGVGAVQPSFDWVCGDLIGGPRNRI